MTWEWGASWCLWEERERNSRDVPQLPVLPLPSQGASPLLEALSFPWQGNEWAPKHLRPLCFPPSLRAACLEGRFPGGSCSPGPDTGTAWPLCPPRLGCDTPRSTVGHCSPTAHTQQEAQTASDRINAMVWADWEICPPCQLQVQWPKALGTAGPQWLPRHHCQTLLDLILPTLVQLGDDDFS